MLDIVLRILESYWWAAIVFIVALIVWIVVYQVQKKSDPETDILESLGFAYDSKQDIFYSTIDAWQRKFGYCRLYDEAAAPCSMIIDCEPIYFEYGEKKWLIELWKGQYGICTGFEVGVYTTTGPELEIPGVFNGTFYGDTLEEDLLQMSYILMKNGKILFRGEAKHWWLTGFKVGEFSNPSELRANVRITLKDLPMREAFVTALKEAGYQQSEYRVYENTVLIAFGTPHASQPETRTTRTETIAQMNNRRLCESYQEIAEKSAQTLDSLTKLKADNPRIYKKITSAIHPQKLYKGFAKIGKALEQ